MYVQYLTQIYFPYHYLLPLLVQTGDLEGYRLRREQVLHQFGNTSDPEIADRTYIEPVTPEYVELVIAKEKPDALLPTMGGQTALNVAMKLHESGVLEKYGVELIGASADAIDKAEDRERFREAMHKIGLATPRSHQVLWPVSVKWWSSSRVRPSVGMMTRLFTRLGRDRISGRMRTA